MTNSNESSDHDPPQWARSLSAALDRVHSQPAKPSATAREAAVLVPLTDGPDGVQVLLTERASGLRSYPGQVTFPAARRIPPTLTPQRRLCEKRGRRSDWTRPACTSSAHCPPLRPEGKVHRDAGAGLVCVFRPPGTGEPEGGCQSPPSGYSRPRRVPRHCKAFRGNQRRWRVNLAQ
jgi:hypothetical protein